MEASPSPYDQSALLVALWALGAPGEPLPVSDALDRALHACASELPASLGRLTFSVTHVGLRCFELPAILLSAQDGMMLVEEPAAQRMRVQMGDDAARQTVLRHGISTVEARRIGAALQAEVARLLRVAAMW
ncbi:MAG: hypothetical protein HQL38_03140 [Alphaproteobacteria bacterium]|nr:hypothetical protein [Alphaproteobacteria bacterium]